MALEFPEAVHLPLVIEHAAEGVGKLADPEMGLRSVEYLLPHFLHGKSVAVIRDDTRAVLECVSDTCCASGNGHMSELIRVLWDARQTSAKLTPEEAARLDAIG